MPYSGVGATLQSNLVRIAPEQLWDLRADPEYTLLVVQAMGSQTAAK